MSMGLGMHTIPVRINNRAELVEVQFETERINYGNISEAAGI